jgi:tetratricopeptide (TPR) repeat protein
VLDNAHDYHQIDPLLPGAGVSRAIVTSRNRMPSMSAVHQAQPIALEPFDDEEVVEFFRQRLPLSLVDDDRGAMIRLGQACGGLPLALSIIGARAAANPAFPLDLLVREFTQEPTPLASLSAGIELDLGTVFSWSQRGLSKDASHTFEVLGAHPGPDITTAAAASMASLDLRRTREVLTELTLASVLRESRPGRFAIHDLVRQHALALLEDGSRDASARLVNHYVRSTRNAILTFGRPGIAPVDDTMAGIEPERFSAMTEAIQWYVEERRTLQAACRLAMSLGDHRSALMLILDWRPMSQNVDATTDILPWAELALQAAQHVEEPILKAESYRDVAAKLAKTGDTARARTFFDLAAATFDELSDRAGLANLYRNMAMTLITDPHEAVDLLRKSVAIARNLENPPVLAASLVALGLALRTGLTDLTSAAAAYSECLTIATTEGLRNLEIQARTGIVQALTASHDYEAAVNEAQPLLALLLREHTTIDELVLLQDYGEALMSLGRHAEAAEAWRRYLDLATPELAEYLLPWMRRTGDEVIAGVRAKLETLMEQRPVDAPHAGPLRADP